MTVINTNINSLAARNAINANQRSLQTSMQSLATGGGLNQRGTEKGIRVHRKAADGKVQVITPTMDDALRDGDVVYVRESLF